jgi:hypothetical protein
MFTKGFDRFACTGDTIECEVDGVRFVATLAHDTETMPTDFECYDPEASAAWDRDEWFFVGVVLSAYVGEVLIAKHAASLWGVECNYPGSDNVYLMDAANELLGDASEVAHTRIDALKASPAFA